MKKEYNYYVPSTRKQVSLPKSSIMNKLFCKHDWVPLVREKKDAILLSLRGDEIQYVCSKCGKLGDTGIWEFEGMGYK